MLYLQIKGSIDTIKAYYTDHFPDSSNIDSNPLFANASNNDLTLQDNSPCIDSGVWLTNIKSSDGSGISFVVDDARYFYSGWIHGENGDLVKTESGQNATITDIDYITNKITVSNSISWTQNEGIALNYSGNAPDIGAYEYGGTSPSKPGPPNGLRIIN